jgi:hypothetical protein
VLLLETWRVLPVDAIGGTHVAFVPLAFLLGFSAAGTLEIASRLDRRERLPVGEPAAVPSRAPAVAPTPAPPPTRVSPPAPPAVVAEASPPAPRSEREIDDAPATPPPVRRIQPLPFQRRR